VLPHVVGEERSPLSSDLVSARLQPPSRFMIVR
jgi:hypothetical protein